jgi:hypothetical protein
VHSHPAPSAALASVHDRSIRSNGTRKIVGEEQPSDIEFVMADINDGDAVALFGPFLSRRACSTLARAPAEPAFKY